MSLQGFHEQSKNCTFTSHREAKTFMQRIITWKGCRKITSIYNNFPSYFFLTFSVNHICLSSSGPHSTISRCPPNEYQCGGTELCIHMSRLCNGVPDCTDGWDEGPHCRGITVTKRQKMRTHAFLGCGILMCTYTLIQYIQFCASTSQSVVLFFAMFNFLTTEIFTLW